ncbi:MAG TPA: ThuA domain-containing protein [Thermoguttaceae bacterium]|nr:ThuA domain-containing protein [Thermoguttaceae bacterium]
MRTQITLSTLAVLILSVAVSCSPTAEKSPVGLDGEAASNSDSLKVAVVTGGHAFDVPNFYRLLRQLPGIDAYPQHIDHFASSPEEVRDAYDAVVFYGMHQGLPVEKGGDRKGNPKEAIERIVEQGQGVVVLHHALLAWEEWEFWNQLIGFDDRNFAWKDGLQLKISVADKTHPITTGMSDFETVDEGYVLHGKYDGKGSVLLTTEHENAMPEVAWAREEGDCRVFCLALGHDDKAWTNPGFREVLARGIAWSAGKSAEK